MNTKGFDYFSLTLVVIGAINWGLVGFFNYNLIDAIFGFTWFTRVIYALVGIAGIYCFSIYSRIDSRIERID